MLAGAEVTGERRYDHDVENASVVLAQYPERQQALFVTGPANPQPHPITVRGSKGLLLLFEDQPAQLYTRDGFEEIVPEAVMKGEFNEDDYMSGFTFLLRDLVEAAQRGERSRCDVSVCAAATEVALAAHESARTNQRVALPLNVKFAPLEVLNETAKPLAHGLRALVYADDHFGSGGRNGLRAALGAITGQPPVMLDAAAHALSEDDLAATDLICLYHTQEDALGATKEALTNWVEAGKPLLLVHAALGAYPAWDEYGRWLGYVWKWGSSSHPHEPAPLFTAEGDPLNFGWARAWLPKDEVYVDLEKSAETLDGVYTALSTGQFPVAWTSVAHPNIGAWMPGHREDSWRSPTMQQGVALLIAQMLKRSRLGS